MLLPWVSSQSSPLNLKGSIGFKVSVGTPMGNTYTKLKTSATDESNGLPFVYLAPAFQFTNRNFTGFVQITGAEKAFNMQIGTNIRLNTR